MKMKKIHFKNDPFNIKFKIFNWKMNFLFKKINRNSSKQLNRILNLVDSVNYPSNDEELEVLKFAVDKFDNLIQKLEKDNLSHARIYIEDYKNYKEKE